MDLYIVLGLDQRASEGDIKRAYRRLARRFHPDINPGDHTAEVRFRQILEAYETLVDPSRRSRYDAGHQVEPDKRRASEFEGFDFSRGAPTTQRRSAISWRRCCRNACGRTSRSAALTCIRRCGSRSTRHLRESSVW